MSPADGSSTKTRTRLNNGEAHPVVLAHEHYLATTPLLTVLEPNVVERGVRHRARQVMNQLSIDLDLVVTLR